MSKSWQFACVSEIQWNNVLPIKFHIKTNRASLIVTRFFFAVCKSPLLMSLDCRKTANSLKNVKS